MTGDGLNCHEGLRTVHLQVQERVGAGFQSGCVPKRTAFTLWRGICQQKFAVTNPVPIGAPSLGWRDFI